MNNEHSLILDVTRGTSFNLKQDLKQKKNTTLQNLTLLISFKKEKKMYLKEYSELNLASDHSLTNHQHFFKNTFYYLKHQLIRTKHGNLPKPCV